MNNLVLLGEVVVTFGLLIIVHRTLGREGLMAWLPVASILANIITAKSATLLGMDATLGTVLFASTFLATDILSECYSKADAKKAVYMGLFGTFMLIVSTQFALAYMPNIFDYADEAMRTLFSLNLRISISSMAMYFVANICDVYLYNKLKEKTGNKMMWLRNNISTIICNCLENFLFIFFAFVGIYSTKEIIMIALSTSIIEMVVAICDTPFLYIAKKIQKTY